MEKLNYYQRLEISYSATQEEIKKAYRICAKKYHPDLNKEKDTNEEMKLITEAYDILSDPIKRKRYDSSISIKTDDVIYNYSKTKEESEKDFNPEIIEYLKKFREMLINSKVIDNFSSEYFDYFLSLIGSFSYFNNKNKSNSNNDEETIKKILKKS